jgi:hypothetical protein
MVARKPCIGLGSVMRPPGHDIATVQAATLAKADNFFKLPRLDRASDRRVAVEAGVRSVLVVIAWHIGEPNAGDDGHRARSDDLASLDEGCLRSLRIAILSRGSWRGPELFDGKVSHSGVEGAAVDSVAIPGQMDHVGIGPDGLDDLLRGPRGIRLAP